MADNKNMLGPYEILEEIGSGGMGKVYKAYHSKLDKTVAIKVLMQHGHSKERDQERFLGEAKLTARLRHPNIVTIYDIGSHEDKPYIVMEFIAGQSLASIIRNEKLPQRRALEIMRDVALAVECAHQNHIIHRDLKPENIMIEQPGGRPVVMDFGLAKNIGLGKDLTKSGEILGTPRYLAPEQAQGQIRQISAASDIFALGAILYEILTGTPAVQGISPFSIMFNLVNRDIVPLRRHNARLAVDLETICHKALDKDPGQRYSSAKALAEDIDHFLNGEIISARRSPMWYRMWKKILRHRVSVVICTSCALLFLACHLWLSWQMQEHGRQRKLAEWRSWWLDFRKQVNDNFIIWQNIKACQEQAWQNMQGWRQIQPSPDSDNLLFQIYFVEFQDYQERLATLWLEYGRLLQQASGLVPQYRAMHGRYLQLGQSLEVGRDVLAELVNKEMASMPAEQKGRFGLAIKDNRGPAEIVLDYWQEQSISLAHEANGNYEEYKARRHPLAIERAKWQAELAVVIAREYNVSGATHGFAGDIHSKIRSFIEHQYNTTLQSLISMGTPDRIDFKESDSVQDFFRQMNAATGALYSLCLMDGAMAEPYYYLGRLCMQAGKYYEAAWYFKQSYQRKPDFWALYHQAEAYLDLWSEKNVVYFSIHLIKRKISLKQFWQDLKNDIQEIRQKLVALDAATANFDSLRKDILLQRIRHVEEYIISKEEPLLEQYLQQEIQQGDEGINPFYYFCPLPPAMTPLKAEQQIEAIAAYQNWESALQKMSEQEMSIASKSYLQGKLYLDMSRLVSWKEGEKDPRSYLEEACKVLQQATRSRHFFPEAWHALAEAYHHAGDTENAVVCYETYFEQMGVRGNLEETCPWLVRNYWKYIMCLLSQKQTRKAQTKVENYIARWRYWLEEVDKDNHRPPSYPLHLLRMYQVLALIYLVDNNDERLKAVVGHLQYTRWKQRVPSVETILYAIAQIKLGNREEARVAMEKLAALPEIKPITAMMQLMKPALRTPEGQLLLFDDPFASDHKFRKAMEMVERMSVSAIADQATGPLRFFLQMGNHPTLFRYLMQRLQGEKQLGIDFSAVMDEVVGSPVSISLFFYLYARAGVFLLQKRLLTMQRLPSAELYYCRAAFHYTRSWSDKGREQERWQSAWLDVEAAMHQEPANQRYHYALAMLASHLATADAEKWKERAYFHLELALELGWQDRVHTANDPAFQALAGEKRFQKLLAGTRTRLCDYAWPELGARIEALRQQKRNEDARTLFYAYSEAVDANLEQHDPDEE